MAFWLHRLIGADNATQLAVDPKQSAARTQVRPYEHNVLGHYRVNWRTVIVASQSASSRLFEMRNSRPETLIIPTRLIIKWLNTGAHTAVIENSIDVFKCAGFVSIDTTNVALVNPSSRRTTMANLNVNSAPAAQFRALVATGNLSGMSGGTQGFTDTSSIGQLTQLFPTTLPTTSQPTVFLIDNFDDVNGTSPFGFAGNEGLFIQTRAAFGVAASSSVYIDLSWVEVLLNR